MRAIHGLFLVLAVAFAAFSLGLSTSPIRSWGDALFSNLAAGFLGSFLTILFIDRSIDKEKKFEQQRFRAIAFRQLRPALVAHISLVCEWYKAVAEKKPDGAPMDFDQLFSDQFCAELRYLDFSRLAPTAPPISWLEYSSGEVAKFHSDFNAVIDKYAFFLDPDSLEMIDDLASSHIVRVLRGLPRAMATIFNTRSANATNNFFAGSGVGEHLKSHLVLLVRFLAFYNKIVSKPIDWSELPIWRSDVGGSFGSARMSDVEMRASNPDFEMGEGIEPKDGTKTRRKPM